MARKIAAKRKTGITKPVIMKNQFFGMLILAVGIGALIVMVRYFVISLYVPTSVYLIQPSDLIPGTTSQAK
ncbi:MAG: hypothetical protein WAV40_03695 [Microgenomates group bacterium]